MIGGRHLDGDRVLVRPNVHVGNGEIAAVQVDGSDGNTLRHAQAHPFSGAGSHSATACFNPLMMTCSAS
jgi:hypothetical protein